jgi:hypothetical protein
VGDKAWVSWVSCKGRNGWDHPLAIPDDMGAEMLNVIFQDGGLAKKRGGSSAVTLSANPSASIAAMAKFVPGQSLEAAELFMVFGVAPAVIARVHTGNTKSDLTLTDAYTSSTQDTTFASVGGNLYIAYDSAVNRLHRYAPALSTTAVTRAGMAAPVAATVANTGAGSYTATARYYKIQDRARTSPTATITTQSELSPSVAFTPSGTGTAARITKPAASRRETPAHNSQSNSPTAPAVNIQPATCNSRSASVVTRVNMARPTRRQCCRLRYNTTSEIASIAPLR